jgi:hypothetical protein
MIADIAIDQELTNTASPSRLLASQILQNVNIFGSEDSPLPVLPKRVRLSAHSEAVSKRIRADPQNIERALAFAWFLRKFRRTFRAKSKPGK